jgi:hypothetical protein
VAVHVLHPEDPAEERKSPEEAEPLLNPKVDNSFLTGPPPQSRH